ncbi:hypothetical protein C1280_26565 [Gemmata obscuriglobus]|uniref:Uncharacterized protein n=1 Tax=Gemmata obscuriglobus TaxID=114 RepID=A0A2Z3H9B8_9BACT|nr:hypothetical protein C1280_26565 [Gemmata obscuriglobus]
MAVLGGAGLGSLGGACGLVRFGAPGGESGDRFGEFPAAGTRGFVPGAMLPTSPRFNRTGRRTGG